MKKIIAVDVIVLGAVALLGTLALAEFAPSEGDRAAEAYHQARNAGASNTQLCRSAKAVEAIYRANGQGSEADHWAQNARTDCNGAALVEGYRPY